MFEAMFEATFEGMLKTTFHAVALCILVGCGVVVVSAQDRQVIVLNEKGKDHFETDFAAGGRFQLEVQSGDVRISGTDNNKISIHYLGRNVSDVQDVKVRCKKQGSAAALEISGAPHNDFHILIEIPRESDLRVRMPFGELVVEKVHGAKDVELHAGQVTMDIGDPKDYDLIEASVLTGELDLSAIGVEKGGLFRSYKKAGPGKYRLYAHVGSGEIDFR
jgi:hypothetical protein